MSTKSSLKRIASEPNWIAFAKALRGAMRSPEQHGFESVDRLLDAVARLRGVEVATLRNPLAAELWLARNAPEQTFSEKDEISMTGVLLLAQISSLSSTLASDLAPKFFSGEVSRSQLRAALETAKKEAGGLGGVAHERFRKAMAFENFVFSYLSENLDALGFGAAAKIERCPRKASFPCDFIVSVDGHPTMAIEVKGHRQKHHRRYLLQVLGMLSLLTRKYPGALLIAPSSWDDSMKTLSEWRDEFRMDNLHLATIDDQISPDSAILHFFNKV
ncbi:hypothetical protein [Pontibaca salina]|uniref:Uncharacterized protein n=1 Tax=Pontibaca salina TaxID=2795731 RepID=A0A934M4B4_9RHOB|nr:hypothetical protein [Pontibaca salina]MBI6630734.1 hypothetical protein [Pontibaca salina]